ncbi:MAG: hypothetical protein L7F77_16360 [Candidatus Magnetominusculus sp. LBB02]|nr:hypothetical protein [Candidatus Magnetominusculus sp. LBB02]
MAESVLRYKVILIVALTALVIAGAGCDRTERPAIAADGDAKLEIPAGIHIFPWYHNKETIAANHMILIAKEKVAVSNCLPCHHEPDKFCNKCHEYVGVRKVLVGKTYKDVLALEMPVAGIPAPPSHTPIETWKTGHDETIIYGKETIATCSGCHTSADNFCNKCHENAGIRKIKY